MDENLKLLEERVLQAATRLRELGAEKGRLEQELRSVKKRLESLEAAPGGRSGTRPPRDEKVVEVLRQVVRELREA